MAVSKLNVIGLSLLMVSMVFLIFSKLLNGLVPVFSMLDEVFLFVFFLIVVYKLIQSKSVDKYAFFIVLCCIIFILISIKGKYYTSFLHVFIGALIHIKWFIFFYIVYVFFSTRYEFLNIGLKTVMVISFTGIILNILLQTKFNSIFNQEIDIRDGFLRMNGFELQPNNLAIFITLLFIYYNFSSGLPSYFKITSSTLVFTFIIVVLVGSRTSLLILPAVYIYLLLKKKEKMLSMLVFGAMAFSFVIVLIFFGGSIVERTQTNIASIQGDDNGTSYMRGLMIVNGVKIMTERFPIGTGVATYGTKLSAGSKVYEDMEIGRSGVFENMSGGVFDSNFASIVGEVGFIGLVLILFLLWYSYRLCKKHLIGTTGDMHFINLTFMTVLIFFVVRPLLVNGYPCMMYAIFVNLQLAKYQNESFSS